MDSDELKALRDAVQALPSNPAAAPSFAEAEEKAGEIEAALKTAQRPQPRCQADDRRRALPVRAGPLSGKASSSTTKAVASGHRRRDATLRDRFAGPPPTHASRLRLVADPGEPESRRLCRG